MTEQIIKQIGITQGDINSSNYEEIIRALIDTRMLEIATPIIYGSVKVAAFYRKATELNDFHFQTIKDIDQAVNKKNNILNINDQEIKIEKGTSTKTSIEMAHISLQKAVSDIKNNKLAAIISLPSAEESFFAQNKNFKNYDEYISKEFGINYYLKILVSDNITIAIATESIALNKVFQTLNSDIFLNKIRILNQSLINDFGSTNPKIAVLSFNPYNAFGDEENNVLLPAINKAYDEKINVFGPISAEKLFSNNNYCQFDAVIALHQEQANLIFQLLNNEMRGSVFTAGLPVIFMRPFMEINFENREKNGARGEALRNSIYLAIDIYNNRNSD